MTPTDYALCAIKLRVSLILNDLSLLISWAWELQGLDRVFVLHEGSLEGGQPYKSPDYEVRQWAGWTQKVFRNYTKPHSLHFSQGTRILWTQFLSTRWIRSLLSPLLETLQVCCLCTAFSHPTRFLDSAPPFLTATATPLEHTPRSIHESSPAGSLTH